jgi:hypothetical protein
LAAPRNRTARQRRMTAASALQAQASGRQHSRQPANCSGQTRAASQRATLSAAKRAPAAPTLTVRVRRCRTSRRAAQARRERCLLACACHHQTARLRAASSGGAAAAGLGIWRVAQQSKDSTDTQTNCDSDALPPPPPPPRPLLFIVCVRHARQLRRTARVAVSQYVTRSSTAQAAGVHASGPHALQQQRRSAWASCCNTRVASTQVVKSS